MKWIVLREDSGKIALVSKNESSDESGLIHIGTYLTIEEEKDVKFILRVEGSSQYSPYDPSPMIVDLGFNTLPQDQNTKNLIHATRIMELPDRRDGKSSFIKPQTVARLSTQREIESALGNESGMPIFMGSAYGRNNQILRDFDGKLVLAKVPDDVFFHQILITGKTGSGKTVAMKYMAQYFTSNFLDGFEDQPGAVLAINVKGEDLLRMDKPSTIINEQIKDEWDTIGVSPHGVPAFRIYYPGNSINSYSPQVSKEKCVKITLKTENIDPEALTGLVQNLSVQGADHLPAIFRFWQRRTMRLGDTLGTFVDYLSREGAKDLSAMNVREDTYVITLHPGTFGNIIRTLSKNTQYFDIPEANELSAEEILEAGKMSVIDVSDKDGIGFGGVLLRDILEKIYETKSRRDNHVPILIIIDEVHEFYGDARRREALQSLDAITRKGRSLGIGVVFASQNPEDMPKGISSVVNTKIHFRSDSKNIDLKGTEVEPEALKEGFAITQIYGMSALRFVKFPLSPGGVFDGKRN